ncbi:MAG: ATP-binding cassette domain-containing protein [Coriobacteriaceae bacterium]|jgi:ABC-2 type transport system ATP-binding protein|nr:ATP-binding cassette domain-containing protein [Coriobacteriaceae bacterium]
MSKAVNTFALGHDERPETDDHREIMVKVDGVSMVFNMASEQLNSLKEYAIKLARRELFFTGFKALDNISFEVKKGDVFGIVGTNGSGKSTLLKIIAGVLEPSEGSCEIRGNIAPLIELGAGFDEELTARENIYLNGALLGYSKKFIDENFDDIVAFAEIEVFLDMPLKNYSSGMVARIAFAVATVIVPDILIVDEVLSVGDFMFQKKCEERINELIETHGVTVLIVSHSNEQIERLCNKVIWIERGNARKMGAATEICETYRALGGRVGTAESEARVIAAINDKADIPDDAYTMVAGDDFCNTAARAGALIWKDTKFDTVAIACGTTHINTILANGIAGAYNAPVFPTKINRISDSLSDLLAVHRPKRILFFDCGSHATSALDRLRKLEWKPEIVDFSNNGKVFDLAKEVFAYGKERGLWKRSAVVVDFADNAESMAAAPYVYREKCPVFSSSEAIPLDPHELLEILVSAGIEKVTIFGNSVPEEVERQCREHGIEVARQASEPLFQSCIDICEWLLTARTGGKGDLCVASMSIGLWPDALACGAWAAHRNGALLLQDPTDLDSVAACLDFVSRHKKDIGRLVFFGGDQNLGNLDRKLLYKALM